VCATQQHVDPAATERGSQDQNPPDRFASRDGTAALGNGTHAGAAHAVPGVADELRDPRNLDRGETCSRDKAYRRRLRVIVVREDPAEDAVA
jgi:hypothetical protein